MLLAMGILIGGIFGWKYFQQQQQQAAQAGGPPPATVSSAEVQLEHWQRRLEAVGSFVAVQGTRVTTEVPGLVETIHFRSGHDVAAGDLLIELDDTVDRAELKQLLAEAQLAQREFKRQAQLLRKGNTTQSAYDTTLATLQSLRARAEAKRAVIRKKHVTAPFSGQLGIRQVNLGEYLEPGSAIVLLQALDPIYLDFTLPEQHVARVAKNQRVTVTVRAFPDRTFEGRITAINPGVDPETRNIRVRATFENPEHHLRPGMFGEVLVLLPRREEVMTLPQTAVTYNPYGDNVFLIKTRDDGQFVVQRRQVRTGSIRDGRVEIVEGLETGQHVVAAGHMKLTNGQRITIDNSVELRPGPVTTP